MASNTEDWITLAAALKAVEGQFGATVAKDELLSRLRQGALVARAGVKNVSVQQIPALIPITEHETVLPAAFWREYGTDGFEVIDWASGEIERHVASLDVDGPDEIHKLFDIRVLGSALDAFATPGDQSRPKNKGGRRYRRSMADAIAMVTIRLLEMPEDELGTMTALRAGALIAEAYVELDLGPIAAENAEGYGSGIIGVVRKHRGVTTP